MKFDPKIKIMISLTAFLLIGGSSYFIYPTFPSASSPSPAPSAKKILYWIDAMEPQVHYDHPGKSRMNMDLIPVYEEAPPDKEKETQPTIRISPAVINNLGVRTAIVTEKSLTPTIKAFGAIQPDEDKIAHIHSYVDGWIQKLYTKEPNESVEKDTPLFDIYSRDLMLAQKEYLLSSKGNEQADNESALGKLRTLGVSEKQIEQLKITKRYHPLVTIYAPQKGYINLLNIREGMWVRPETTIMSLTDLSEVWVIAEVFPSQLSLIKPGQETTVTFPQSFGQIRHGKVDYIYPEIDPTSLTAKVRIRLSNPGLLLKPNLYVGVEIQTHPKKALTIPKEAVIWEKEGQHVIVALEGGKFHPQKVVTGLEDSGQIEIVSGLREGEKVVTSAQFMLDSEVNLKSALQRLETPSPPMENSHEGHGS